MDEARDFHGLVTGGTIAPWTTPPAASGSRSLIAAFTAYRSALREVTPKAANGQVPGPRSAGR